MNGVALSLIQFITLYNVCDVVVARRKFLNKCYKFVSSVAITTLTPSVTFFVQNNEPLRAV